MVFGISKAWKTYDSRRIQSWPRKVCHIGRRSREQFQSRLVDKRKSAVFETMAAKPTNFSQPLTTWTLNTTRLTMAFFANLSLSRQLSLCLRNPSKFHDSRALNYSRRIEIYTILRWFLKSYFSKVSIAISTQCKLMPSSFYD